MIALQVLERIEIVHSNYFIHRNIKPDVFYIGKEDPNIIYLTNLCLVSKYRSSTTKNHIKFKLTGKLFGTIRFASPNALKGGQQSRKDDLISIGYMLIYFMKKKLPWQHIKASNPTDKYIKIYKMKKEIRPENLCYNLPWEIAEYMKYVQYLGFEQNPDYQYLKNLFKSILNNLEFNIDHFCFSWIKNSHKAKLKYPINSILDIKQNGYDSDSDSSNNLSQSLEPAPPAIDEINMNLKRNKSYNNLFFEF